MTYSSSGPTFHKLAHSRCNPSTRNPTVAQQSLENVENAVKLFQPPTPIIKTYPTVPPTRVHNHKVSAQYPRVRIPAVTAPTPRVETSAPRFYTPPSQVYPKEDDGPEPVS